MSFAERRRISWGRTAAFSPNGMYILSARTNIVRVWNMETGKELRAFKMNSDTIHQISFSPNNKLIALSSADNSVRIVEIETGIELQSFAGHVGIASPNAFSPDSKRFVTVDINTVTVWDIETGAKLLNFEKVFNGFVFSAVFSPDGTLVLAASEDNTAKVWDSKTGNELVTLKHQAQNTPVLFSPDNKYIYATSNGNTVSVWNAKNGAELLSVEGYAASFSPDCRHIVTASSDKLIRIYDFPPLQELIDQTRERFKDRPLTPEERKMYYLE